MGNVNSYKSNTKSEPTIVQSQSQFNIPIMKSKPIQIIAAGAQLLF